MYIKTVKEEDATALADALAIVLDKLNKSEMKPDGTARPTIMVDGVSQEEFEMANRGITAAFLTEFIDFLRKGKFDFTYDD